MSKTLDKYTIQEIESQIFTIRGVQVMIDQDLANMYQVETRVLNQAVKRNIERFPDKFRFQLTEEEIKYLNLQYGEQNLKSQSVIPSGHGGRRYLPYAFTEQGVAMLSAVLRSDLAIKVSVQIMDAFVEMRKTLYNHQGLLQRMDRFELKQADYDSKFEKIFTALESADGLPKQGVFFNGQTFDAYSFTSDLIRSAKKSIQLIDNYVDDTVFTLLGKRNKGVNARIYTKTISKQLNLDIVKHNSQYPKIEIKLFNDAHDRFLIIDEKKVYHIGASVKDLGKKWFAFTELQMDALAVIDKINTI